MRFHIGLSLNWKTLKKWILPILIGILVFLGLNSVNAATYDTDLSWLRRGSTVRNPYVFDEASWYTTSDSYSTNYWSNGALVINNFRFSDYSLSTIDNVVIVNFEYVVSLTFTFDTSSSSRATTVYYCGRTLDFVEDSDYVTCSVRDLRAFGVNGTTVTVEAKETSVNGSVSSIRYRMRGSVQNPTSTNAGFTQYNANTTFDVSSSYGGINKNALLYIDFDTLAPTIGIAKKIYIDSSTDPNQIILNGIDENIKETNDKLEDLEDSITNPNVDSGTGNSFFDNFQTEDNGGISGIITAPLTLINSLLDGQGTCTDLTFPIMGKEVALPSGCIIWDKVPNEMEVLIQTLVCGTGAYFLLRQLFKDIEKLKNPNNSEVSTLDL